MANTTDTVVLAAGFSSRMGAFKPLLPFGKSTIIETVVDTALTVSVRVIVVVGYQAQLIVGLKKWDTRVVFAENKYYEKGMFSSVKVGVAQVRTPRCFIALGDQPQVFATVYQKLLADDPADVVQPSFKGKAGHPILLNEKVRQVILIADENDPTVNLKTILNRFEKRLVEVNDKSILTDLDTPEDYLRMRRCY